LFRTTLFFPDTPPPHPPVDSRAHPSFFFFLLEGCMYLDFFILYSLLDCTLFFPITLSTQCALRSAFPLQTPGAVVLPFTFPSGTPSPLFFLPQLLSAERPPSLRLASSRDSPTRLVFFTVARRSSCFLRYRKTRAFRLYRLRAGLSFLGPASRPSFPSPCLPLRNAVFLSPRQKSFCLCPPWLLPDFPTLLPR